MASRAHNNNCEPCMFVSLKHVPAEFHCEDCLESYCERCALDHAKFRVLRNHHVGPLQVSSDRDKDYLSVLPYRAGQTDEKIQQAYYNEDATIDINKSLDDNMTDFNTGLTSPDDQFDKLSIHSYEDIEGPTNSTTVSNIHKENDACMTKQKDPTSRNAVDPGARSFNIIVKATELSHRIKQETNNDLQNSETKLTIDSSGLTISAGTKKLITCSFSIIRRYGFKDKHISIELGRGFQYGAGYLKIEYNPMTDLYNAIKEKISQRSR